MTVIAYTSAAPAPLISQSNAVVGQASLPQNIQLYGAGEDTADPGATFTYLWSIISAPPGSTAALSSSTAQNPLLNGVNVWGNYILMLVVTSSTSGASQSNPLLAPDTARVGVQVTSASAGLQKTAQGERNWFPPGYWPVVDKVEQHDQILSTLTLSTQAGGTLTVKAAVNLAAGDIVYPSDIAMVGAETVLVAAKAPATNALVTTSQLLIMEEAVLSGATGNARWFGLSAVSAAGSPAVLDPVYVSDTATLTLTPGTNFRQVGQVVEASGGLYRTLMLAGAAGGGSPTAQVLLQAPDGAFPAGIDISDLSTPVEFTDTAGFLGPTFGAPLLMRFLKSAAAAVGDAVAFIVELKNSLGNAALAGALKFSWLSPTDSAEVSKATVVVNLLGAPTDALDVEANVLKVLDTSAGASYAEITSDTRLKVHTAAGVLLLDGSGGLIGQANGVEGWKVVNNSGDADFLNPATGTSFAGENRVARRRHFTTVNAAPYQMDMFTVPGSVTDPCVMQLETTVVGMTADTLKYLVAKRVGRFLYDGIGWTQMGSTYVPVPDEDSGDGLAVDISTSAVYVTGLPLTSVYWTAWTQFLITKIG